MPSGNPSTGTLPSSYERATVTYLDANAREVNTATPGGNISATCVYDQWGNTVRYPDRRQPGPRRPDTNPPRRCGDGEHADPQPLSTLNTYSLNGQLLLRHTVGPEHDVMLPTGSVVRGRQHTMNTYDQGAPTTGGPYNLITKQDPVGPPRIRTPAAWKADSGHPDHHHRLRLGATPTDRGDGGPGWSRIQAHPHRRTTRSPGWSPPR